MKKYHDYSDRVTPVARYILKVSKTEYHRMRDGSLKRISPPRPYRGKAERRQEIKARRTAKELALAA